MRLANGLEPATAIAFPPAKRDGGRPVGRGWWCWQRCFKAAKDGLGASKQTFKLECIRHWGSYTLAKTKAL